MVGSGTPRCERRALVRFGLDTGKWVYLCDVHVGEFLSETRPGKMADTLKKLDAPPKRHTCDRPMRGRDMVWLAKRAALGEADAPGNQARDLGGAAVALGTALKERDTGVGSPSAAVVVGFGDVAARFAVLAATLGLDFDAMCAGVAKGLQAGGQPSAAPGAAEGEPDGDDDGSGEEEAL